MHFNNIVLDYINQSIEYTHFFGWENQITECTHVIKTLCTTLISSSTDHIQNNHVWNSTNEYTLFRDIAIV